MSSHVSAKWQFLHPPSNFFVNPHRLFLALRWSFLCDSSFAHIGSQAASGCNYWHTDWPVCPCRAGIATTPPSTCRNARSSEPSQLRVALASCQQDSQPRGHMTGRLTPGHWWPVCCHLLTVLGRLKKVLFFFLTPPKDAAMHCTKNCVIESDCQSNGHMCRFTETGAGCMACWGACLSQKSEPLSNILFIYLFAFFYEFKSTFKPGTVIHLRAFIQFVSVNLVHYPHPNKYFELDRKKTTTTNFEPLKLLSSCLQEKWG